MLTKASVLPALTQPYLVLALTFPTTRVNITREGLVDAPHQKVLRVTLPHDQRRRPTHPMSASSGILVRIDSLIDDLLNQSDLASSSLASIMMAARESVHDGYHVALARRIWDVNNHLRLRECPEEPRSNDRAKRADD
jgi:hypothetical protein